jgi:hypothetical protein
MLLDGEATREAILRAFQDRFIHNNRIMYDDPMLFFFAGHGSRSVAPAGWTTDDGHVETMCPHDESVNANDQSNVFGIPVRTIWALIHELADAKGSNLTMILDCCHSRGATGGRIVRGLDSHTAIPSSLDMRIWGPCADRYSQGDIPSRYLHRNMSSHVLLTACSQVSLIYMHAAISN